LGADDEGYTDFIHHQGYAMGVLALFSAFTFTLMGLILAEVADASVFNIQVILFFLSMLFYLSLYLLGHTLAMNTYYVKKRPPFAGAYKVFEYGVFVLFELFGLVVPLIFIVWRLYLVAGVNCLAFAAFSIMAIKFILQPLLEAQKAHTRQ